MYGKHYESMYEGSMYGAGVAVFAVWGYVISHAREGVLELNPRKLADTLGGEVEEIVEAIKKLEEPDKESRHKEEGGRRLVKEGEFQYRVPSWGYYQELKNASDLREYNRIAKRRQRAKKKGGTSSAAQRVSDDLRKNGNEEGARRMEELDEAIRAAEWPIPSEGDEAF